MKITIDLMTPYSEKIKSPIEIELKEGSNLRDMIEIMKEKYPLLNKSFSSTIDRPTVTINDKIIYDMNEVLAESDRIIIFFPVGGG
jgi:molybdopterin converting factor small subunit